MNATSSRFTLLVFSAPGSLPAPVLRGTRRTDLPNCNARQIFSCQRSRLRQQSVGAAGRRPAAQTNCWMVGLGGLEPPTSSLSGMRSSHLSYRPRRPAPYTWWSWSGSNRRPPECKSGALPAELQPQTQPLPHGRGSERKTIEASWMQGPHENQLVSHFKKKPVFQVEIAEAGSLSPP